jgi:hypothetical protein
MGSRLSTAPSDTAQTRSSASTKKVKRRADLVGIFPNEASIIQLIGAILLEQNREWLFQCQTQIEGMAELTPPLIDPHVQPIRASAPLCPVPF